MRHYSAEPVLGKPRDLGRDRCTSMIERTELRSVASPSPPVDISVGPMGGTDQQYGRAGTASGSDLPKTELCDTGPMSESVSGASADGV